jgi:hypothetical protein
LPFFSFALAQFREFGDAAVNNSEVQQKNAIFSAA